MSGVNGEYLVHLLQEEDGAEAALAKLLTSGGDQSSWTMGSFSSTVCLQPVPSEHQLQARWSEREGFSWLF